ncbi:unnamed protein product [Cylicostephanus goldi]|uniref:Uncharacterized protein n=1 Tax=Cylicostephanus goldi TaxID=71465 RepID=A0A3P6SGL1_CYLGO|nr:unnamed protein product [Cylicostephanus goldi]
MPAMPPQMMNMPMSGAHTEDGRQPTAIGYHVEVHQFDVFANPPEQETSQNTTSNALPPSTVTQSASSNGPVPPSTVRPSVPSSFAHGRMRQAGSSGHLPFMMGNMNFPTDLHVTAPRQEIVNVDPFLSCNSRFTDVQRVLRSSNPGAAMHLSPFRRFMRVSLFLSKLVNVFVCFSLFQLFSPVFIANEL